MDTLQELKARLREQERELERLRDNLVLSERRMVVQITTCAECPFCQETPELLCKHPDEGGVLTIDELQEAFDQWTRPQRCPDWNVEVRFE